MSTAVFTNSSSLQCFSSAQTPLLCSNSLIIHKFHCIYIPSYLDRIWASVLTNSRALCHVLFRSGCGFQYRYITYTCPVFDVLLPHINSSLFQKRQLDTLWSCSSLCFRKAQNRFDVCVPFAQRLMSKRSANEPYLIACLSFGLSAALNHWLKAVPKRQQ
jgi:hypothetical protein